MAAVVVHDTPCYARAMPCAQLGRWPMQLREQFWYDDAHLERRMRFYMARSELQVLISYNLTDVERLKPSGTSVQAQPKVGPAREWEEE